MEDWESLCSTILEEIRGHKDAGPFLEPVDPIALGIPNYPDVIKHPMDLSTVQSKLTNHEYPTIEEFKADMKLMFQNCYTFNKRGCYVHSAGKALESAYNNLLTKHFKKRKSTEPAKAKRPAGLMSPEDAKTAESVLDALTAPALADIAWPFLDPITDDAVPGYSAVIKHPTDLSTIRKKVRDRAFDNLKAFYQELRVMTQNCHAFNAAAKKIYDCATALNGAIDALERSGIPGSVPASTRVAEIRAEVQRLVREQQVLEEGMSAEERAAVAANSVYDLQARLEIGVAITQLDQAANARVAEIIQKSGARLHVVEPNLVEIDVRALSDACIAELAAYIEQVRTQRVAFEEIKVPQEQ